MTAGFVGVKFRVFFSQSLEEEEVNEALISYKFPGYKIDIFLLKHSILQYT